MFPTAGANWCEVIDLVLRVNVAHTAAGGSGTSVDRAVWAADVLRACGVSVCRGPLAGCTSAIAIDGWWGPIALTFVSYRLHDGVMTGKPVVDVKVAPAAAGGCGTSVDSAVCAAEVLRACGEPLYSGLLAGCTSAVAIDGW